ncbi:DUF3124 domain-containing protein [Calothrix sp. PCC 6303]|uniref:DUF3124 domain-containing protein n=1 Tax=Calothrix sp. PCC 6303 TaxID=1170562 RepID=UPI0002A0293B|nr:DUF3124 domain-containing protein [Calothrix sp. PCC 6303]AFZ02417.1 hypothetical protein Cal6303_3484 [Calothrix sp. PCC 6303]
MLLTACDAPKNNIPSPTSSPQVEPLTRITQPGTAISVKPEQIVISKGQIVYVPVYSHIYHGDKQEQFPLTVTLSIRNTSLTETIVIRSVRYYNSGGKLVKEHTEGNLQLPALATTEFFIPQQDSSGGSGANFIVEWVSEKKTVTEPIIEAVMISTRLQQGISFVTLGHVIQNIKP